MTVAPNDNLEGYCSDTDMAHVGMQRGEKLASTLRIIAVLISMSLASRWSRDYIMSSPLLFFNWISGLMYPLSQLIMSLLVINCWVQREVEMFIYFLKFIEIISVCLIPLSSLCIFINLSRVVRAFEKSRRVSTMANNHTIFASCMIAFVLATASAVFWNTLLRTGNYFWVTNRKSTRASNWVNLSFSVVGTAVAIVMVLLLLDLIIARRDALIQCVRNSRIIYYHTWLAAISTVILVFAGTTAVLDEVNETATSRHFIMITWDLRFGLIIADACLTLLALHRFDAREERRKRQILGRATNESTAAPPQAPQLAIQMPQQQRDIWSRIRASRPPALTTQPLSPGMVTEVEASTPRPGRPAVKNGGGEPLPEAGVTEVPLC